MLCLPLRVLLLLVVIVSFSTADTSASLNDNKNSSLPEADNWAVQLFGPSLYYWKDSETFGEKSTVSLLQDKEVVAIYFSASWCAPCRQFTPLLSQFYKEMNKKMKGKFEVVLISRDSTPEEFVSYYKKMPWLAVPFTDGRLEKCLEKAANAYRLKGIPHLVVMDGSDGTVFTLDGRGSVMKDKYGLEFPWMPRTPMNIVLSFLPLSARRSVKNYLSQTIGNFKLRLIGFFKGILQGIGTPRVIMDMIYRE